MALLKIAFTGFLKFKERRKNLTMVMIGTFFLIFFFLSLFGTIHQNMRDYWVHGFTGGDFIVSGAVENFNLFAPAPPDQYFSYDQFTKENPGQASQVFPRLRFAALLENKSSNDSSVCIVSGIDPADEKDWQSYVTVDEGTGFQPDQNQIILSETVATNINAKLGDEIIIYAKTKDGYINFDRVKIAGYLNFSSAASFIGQNLAYMPLSRVRELLMTGNNDVNELLYRGNGPDTGITGFHGKECYKKVNALLSFSLVRSLTLAFNFLGVVIFLLITAFAVSSIYHNIVLMSLERTREIGIYLTYGAQPFWIRRIFLAELGIYTLYCALWGALVSFTVISVLNYLGIYSINIYTEILMASNHFIFTMKPLIFLWTFLILLGMVLTGGIHPIWKNTRSLRVAGLFNNTGKR